MDMMTVQNYTSTYNSYVNRLIPYNERHDYIDFLTKFYITHGFLRGTLSRIASFLTPKVQIPSGNKQTKKRIEDIFKDLNLQTMQYNILLNSLVYDNVVVLYLESQTLSIECESCEKSFNIDDSYPYSFQIVDLTSLDKLRRKVLGSSEVPKEEKRLQVNTYGIACTCPHCGSTMKQEPKCKGNIDKTGILKIMNPHHIKIYRNDAGKEFAKVDPEHYEGVLDLGVDLEFMHIDGLPWQLVKTFASREMDFKPPAGYYSIFSTSSLAGIDGESLSPLSGTVGDLMHMDILKIGNEGLAFSKVNPLYVMSPRQTSAISENAFDLVSQVDYRDFIVDEVKQRDEGDFHRMIYSPISVEATPIFGDGKRFLALQELVHFQENVINSLGYNPQVLNGQMAILNDPFTLTSIDTTMEQYNGSMESLLANIIKYHIPTYSREVKDNEGYNLFFLEKPSLTKGSMTFQQKQEAMMQGLLPKGELIKDIGYPKSSVWRQAIREEILEEAREQAEIQRQLGRLQETERMRTIDEQSAQGGVNTVVAKQQIQADAQSHVDQMQGMDSSQRKSYLSQLQNEDPVLYAVVSVQWRQLNNMQTAEAKASMQE